MEGDVRGHVAVKSLFPSNVHINTMQNIKGLLFNLSNRSLFN